MPKERSRQNGHEHIRQNLGPTLSTGGIQTQLYLQVKWVRIFLSDSAAEIILIYLFIYLEGSIPERYLIYKHLWSGKTHEKQRYKKNEGKTTHIIQFQLILDIFDIILIININ